MHRYPQQNPHFFTQNPEVLSLKKKGGKNGGKREERDRKTGKLKTRGARGRMERGKRSHSEPPRAYILTSLQALLGLFPLLSLHSIVANIKEASADNFSSVELILLITILFSFPTFNKCFATAFTVIPRFLRLWLAVGRREELWNNGISYTTYCGTQIDFCQLHDPLTGEPVDSKYEIERITHSGITGLVNPPYKNF